MSSGNAAIQPLPEEVAAQIKSSATLTSLEDVIVGLVKNSLDAGSRRIDISVDFSRGGCTVEDDGCGISPGEFLDTGGLGKAFHTSKHVTANNLHCREGTFLASLAAVSILKITSHHCTNRAIAALIFHHTRAAARLVPAPSHYQLLNRNHGTKVEVHDLFGNMPVRVKHRGLEVSDHREHLRRWESMRKGLVGLILASNSPVDLSFTDVVASRKISVKPRSADRKGATDEHRAEKNFDLGYICSVLSQAGHIEPDTWATWIRTSARTPFISIRGAFSLHPVESKGTQFISLGIRHIGAGFGANILYDEVNRHFALSDFGKPEVSSDKQVARKSESKDRRYKKDGHTNRQLRGTGKGIDKWPMFVIRIDLQEALSRRFAGGDGTEDQNVLSNIVKVLGAMVTSFLSDYHFRPRKSRERRRPVNTNPLGPLSVASASPIAPDSLSKRAQVEPRTGKSNNGIGFSQDLIGHTIQLPNVKMDRTRYLDEGFKKWSRIKSGSRQGAENSFAVRPTTSKKGSVLSDGTVNSQLTSVQRLLDPPGSKPLNEVLEDCSSKSPEDQGGRGGEALEDGIDEIAPDVAAEDTFHWTNPVTKEIISISSRTGLIVPRPPRPRTAATNDVCSPFSLAPTAVGKSLSNRLPGRCTSAPPSVPKTGSWVSDLLKEWENPVFLPAPEQGIPQVSFEGPILETSGGVPAQHRSSHFDLEKAFSTASSHLSSKLSKGNLSNATVIAQVDKKFILVLMTPTTGHGVEQLPVLHKQQILVLIDQHAADERIRVENLLAELCTSASSDSRRITSSLGHKPDVATTLLSKPIVFEVKYREHAMLMAHARHFAYWGILIDLNFTHRDPISRAISSCEVSVKSLPPVIAERCRLEPKLLIDLLRKEIWRRDEDGSAPMIPSLHPSNDECAEQSDWLTRISSCPEGILEMLNSRSCRSAIMFNDKLSVGECEVLVKNLAKYSTTNTLRSRPSLSYAHLVLIMALRLALSPAFAPPLQRAIGNPLLRTSSLYMQHASETVPLGLFNALAFRLITLPSFLSDIWESILRAVPKKKTSHRKKRQRFLAGKALQDVTNLNRCSACGTVKRSHLLCPYCVQEIRQMWKKERWPEEKEEKKVEKAESKQYLTTHTIDDAHITDIFCLAVTPHQVISASGSSSIKIYSTTEPDFPLVQTLDAAHKLGCHHLGASQDGQHFASAGFAGDVKIWNLDQGQWTKRGEIVDGNKAGEIWAIALSADGQYLAATSIDGRINVWDNLGGSTKIREFETKGSFGMAIDLSVDGRYTASGHENGGVYIFNNDTGRLLHSLPGLIKPVRAVAFSPGCKLLAAAGDAKVIGLYDVASGEQVANLTGHGAWVFSLSWSDSGEYLLSGGFDGKAKVWSIDQRACVATHTETDKTLWSVKWLPKIYFIVTPKVKKTQHTTLSMYAKSTVLLALFAASAQLVAATPPGCLIKAINTESEPSNLSVIPSGETGPTGFATGTGVPSPTGNGPSGSGPLSGSGAGSGPSATGSPISPNAPIGTGGAPFTGAASKSIGSFAAAGLALLGLAIAL
ncbi:MAG: hypothetical protein Q9173_006152 [Seirophora scorigena]